MSAPVIRPVPPAAPARPSGPALDLLRRLREPGAFLLVVRGYPRGRVFTEAQVAARSLVATAEAGLAEAAELLAEGLIARVAWAGGMVRFEITEAGRARLRIALCGRPAIDCRTFEGRVQAALRRQRRRRGEVV